MELVSTLFCIAIYMMVNPLIGFLIYILPLVLALILKKRNALPIVILNIILGWFFLAWIMFLLWAIFGEKRQPAEGEEVIMDSGERICQFCTKFFAKDEHVCPHCGKTQRENSSLN